MLGMAALSALVFVVMREPLSRAFPATIPAYQQLDERARTAERNARRLLGRAADGLIVARTGYETVPDREAVSVQLDLSNDSGEAKPVPEFELRAFDDSDAEIGRQSYYEYGEEILSIPPGEEQRVTVELPVVGTANDDDVSRVEMRFPETDE